MNYNYMIFAVLIKITVNAKHFKNYSKQKPYFDFGFIFCFPFTGRSKIFKRIYIIYIGNCDVFFNDGYSIEIT